MLLHLSESLIGIGTFLVAFISFIYSFPKLLDSLHYDLNSNKHDRKHLLLRSAANFVFKLRYLVLPAQISKEYGGKVSDIVIYPLKSCGGCVVDKWQVDAYGLRYDRKFSLAEWLEDKQEYKIITQRDCNRLTLVQTSFQFNKRTGKDPYDGWIKIKYPLKNKLDVFKTFKIPANISPASMKRNKIKPITMWGVQFQAYDLKRLLPKDFVHQLELPNGTTLLYSQTGKFCKTKSPSPTKLIDTDNSYRKTLFQDYYPALICLQSDINKFNNQLVSHNFTFEASVLNFRANIVISDNEKPHDTDNWGLFNFKNVQNGEANVWSMAQKCARCTVPNIDTARGVMDPKSSVTKTMAKYRRVDPLAPFQTFFGTYGIQHSSGYEIRIGDKIEVLQRAVSSYEEPV